MGKFILTKITEMPKNKIEDLRNHLFEALEMLKDGELAVDKAEAIVGVAQVIVETAKVEVAYIKALETNKHSGFLQLENK